MRARGLGLVDCYSVSKGAGTDEESQPDSRERVEEDR